MDNYKLWRCKVSNFKVGDKVWVQCEVKETTHHSVRICFDGVNWFWAGKEDCRSVEPGPVVKESLTTELNDPSNGWEPTKDEVEYAMDRCGVPVNKEIDNFKEELE